MTKGQTYSAIVAARGIVESIACAIEPWGLLGQVMRKYPMATFSPTASLVAGTILLLISSGNYLSAQADTSEIKVEASFAEKLVATTEHIELRFNRTISQPEGRLAILIGSTDVSSLFTRDGLRLSYNAKVWPLPVGETTVTVYLVSKNDEWKELALFTLRVAPVRTNPTQRDAGLNEDSLTNKKPGSNTPSLDGGIRGQSANQPTRDSTQSPSASAKASQTDNSRMKFTPSLTLTIPSQPAQSSFPGHVLSARPSPRSICRLR